MKHKGYINDTIYETLDPVYGEDPAETIGDNQCEKSQFSTFLAGRENPLHFTIFLAYKLHFVNINMA